ncbi:unnamed protein product [Paramecium pentaurelia]|uniref:SPRY domain-containing protein n=1 Tax=Paramecium pentaurelia TaxID=43138 RepID=A0A8S1XDE2_9CILI|nr:unnamed protein product [Paramecium pentaurelia]
MIQSCKCEDGGQKIIGVCTALNCQSKRASCVECLKQLHLQHANKFLDLKKLQVFQEDQMKTFSYLKKLQNDFNRLKSILDNFIVSLNIEAHEKNIECQTISQLNSLTDKLVKLNYIEQSGYLIKSFQNLIQNMEDAKNNIQRLKIEYTLNEFISPSQNICISVNSSQLQMQIILSLYRQQKNMNTLVIKEKIRFSQQYKTDNIVLKDQETMVQTTDDKFGWVLCEPGIIQNQFVKNFAFEISKNDWLAIGICHKDQFLKQKGNFDIWDNNNHGCYLIDQSGKVFSQLKIEENNKSKNFKINNQDIIIIIVDKTNKKIQWINQTQNTQLWIMEFDASQDFYPVVCLRKSSIKVIDLK